MHKVIRDLYNGDICPNEKPYEKTEELIKAHEKFDIVHEKIISALVEKYGNEQALVIDNEWFGVRATLENEEMLSVFKEGLFIGFDLGLALTQR
ncbi:DUF6809 family protein [Thomasclavelia cocleata]|jgi:hypothetical protein|uniref:DUF6809 family protein n=1 Tax=Thomasclavelia cocleata TaxID=69824 RepID=UPI00241E4542|nr:DUF6809 family protein [Thomasclavelia cocleata]